MENESLSVSPSDFVSPVDPKYSDRAREKLNERGIIYRKLDIRDAVTLENDILSQGIWSVIQDWQKEVVRAQEALILEAVRKADAGGKHGVKVVRTRSGAFVSALEDETVPFGEVHIFDSEDDLKLALDTLTDRWFYRP